MNRIRIADFESDLTGAHVAQLVEHVLGKDEVISSILIMGSSKSEVTKKQDNEVVKTRHTTSGERNGKRAISKNETARQRRHDRPHRPWQIHTDCRPCR